MTPISDFFEHVYVPLRLRSSSPNTLRLYRYSIKMFDAFCNGCSTLNDFDDLKVSLYLMGLSKRLKPHSVEKERSQLLAIWNFAAKQGLVRKFPMVPRGRLPELMPQAWSKESLDALMAAIKTEDGDIAGVPASKWWLALHLVLWDTGERIGAVIVIRWANVIDKSILVPAGDRKGKTRDRLYAISDELYEVLQDIKKPERDHVFSWPKSKTTLYHHYKRILKKAGLPCDDKHKFHCMRRSVASHFKRAGGDPTALLDHSDPKTTRAYLDPRIVPQSNAKDLLFRLV